MNRCKKPNGFRFLHGKWSGSAIFVANYLLMKTYLLALTVLVACQSTPKENTTPLYEAQDIPHFLGEETAGLEGPAVDKAGNLFFVNPFKSGSIGRFTPDGKFDMYIDQLPQGSTANGIRTTADGAMYLADYTGHNILHLAPGSQSATVYAHHDSLNQPNDIAIMANGTLFASDPDWKNQRGQLWRIANGQFELLETNMGTTNGVEVSPDEKTLYVNESVQRNIWAYDLSATGDISNKRLFATVADHGMDGMRTDTAGNLYITRWGKGTVLILNPEGEKIQEVTLKGKKPSNIAFGGPDGKTCYVTVQDRGYIETFRTAHPGREFALVNR